MDAENIEGLGMALGVTINGHKNLFPGINQYCSHKLSSIFCFAWFVDNY